MGKYLASRGLQALLVLLGTFTLAFVLLSVLPSDALSIKLSGAGDAALSPDEVARLRAEHGYDDPLVEQYLRQLGGLLGGDLGTSLHTGAPVLSMLGSALPHTAQLAGLALLFGVVAGLLVGSVAAHTRGPWAREALMSLPPLGISFPTFAVGLVLIQVVAFQWQALPSGGTDGFRSLVLPAITLALPVTATVAQVFHRSLREVLEQGYVDTAVAKGAGRARIHLAHATRNAAGPTLTATAVVVGNLLGGAVVTETVFSREGVGRLTADAVTRQDLPVVQGVVLLSALVFVVVNLLVDLAYPLLDRRVTVKEAVR
ncbi:ABC transporter permease [Streptomyces radicis]|uniref:ABC transporter permease n=1 Tax=Streptomyces radicis TaxID=1750517 RepID=A0A3A9VWP2_9ACTN|nr:ABC transporter permease [Streptomyces radicis]RKN04593.1 ABC transporter permease [Streptomyces radicis]RKN15550.1 ABC transporter permease [Streptomyces radicis]